MARTAIWTCVLIPSSTHVDMIPISQSSHDPRCETKARHTALLRTTYYACKEKQ